MSDFSIGYEVASELIQIKSTLEKHAVVINSLIEKINALEGVKTNGNANTETTRR